jgi:GH15 family glucan-1,4-alpha-glucosidase
MKEYEAALRIDGPRRGVGFSRMGGGDWYDTSEWIMLDLRAASAYHRFARVQAARELLGWVTDQASLNYNLIPELFDRKTGRYAGAVPMVGFGAGVYIVTLGDLSRSAGR